MIIEGPDGMEYRRGTNLSRIGDEALLHPADWLEAERLGRIAAIFHSHISWPPVPSQRDWNAVNAWGVPWVIMSVPSFEWTIVEPQEATPPLLGRQWVHEVTDCYELIRDYYGRLGIVLPKFPRHPEWWKLGYDLYMENFAAAGFVPVSELREHDVVLMKIASETVNHGGVYLNGGRLLHHISGPTPDDARVRLSARVVYGQFYQSATHIRLRHKDLL